MENRVEAFAEDYARSAWKDTCYNVAYKSYINGYNQCVEDEHAVDMDEWQKRLSDSYSFMKEVHLDLKRQVRQLREENYKLRNPSHSEKLDMYLKLREEFEKKEVCY